ncbi:LysR family transcriptional regulator [Sphingomonas radiodurans]|uniref:LysR family transcriptional regulator n=1 Tax=Sphingomonas radiodurans TaxID=2890321 RepID=UPI0038CD8349
MAGQDDLRIACLDAFVAVAERRTYTAAGKALGSDQSQVTRRVQALERWLGSPLFDGSSPATLSPFGEEFLITAKEVLARLRDSRQCSTPAASTSGFRVSGKNVPIP